METEKQNNGKKYNRHTELRHLDANDIFELGLILDDNDCWKKLMEIIPKKLDAQAASTAGQLDWYKSIELAGPKYNNDHMRLVENATRRSSDSARLYSQTLFDEWSTSGRKHERPTVGVLLQLLVQAELFRAADYVAKEFLGEPPPERPLNGPAARIEISLPSELFNDIEDMVNDSNFYPGTEALNANADALNSIADNNRDYYMKYQCTDKDLIINDNVAPKPPPRQGRSTSLRQQQNANATNKLETIQEVSNHKTVLPNTQTPQTQSNEQNNSNNFRATINTNELPKLSELLIPEQPQPIKHINTNNDVVTEGGNLNSAKSETTQLSEAIIPNLSILENIATSKKDALDKANDAAVNIISIATTKEILPVISALNLNGERDETMENLSDEDSLSESSNSNHNGSMDEEDADMAIETRNINEQENEEPDDDNSLPNLSIFGERSSNNDSSLTNVTGTSGDNSFEISTNDSSSASNDDNVPCLSALQQ